jgi:FkbM family methyltransferase
MLDLEQIKRRIKGTPIEPVARWIFQRYISDPLSAAQQNALYDLETIDVMARVLRPDSCCIDVGAHQGTILKEMVRRAPRGQHIAFEALPHLASELRTAFPAVCVCNVAVSDRTGAETFVYVENDPSYSGLLIRDYDRPDPVLKRIPVELARIDDLVPTSAHIAFIKIDIEGGEFHALRGAASTIRRCRPVVVLEASQGSTGHYGVTPGDFYVLVTEDFGYHLSTMRRWLDGQPPYSKRKFCQNWQKGPEFYFITYPRIS